MRRLAKDSPKKREDVREMSVRSERKFQRQADQGEQAMICDLQGTGESSSFGGVGQRSAEGRESATLQDSMSWQFLKQIRQ